MRWRRRQEPPPPGDQGGTQVQRDAYIAERQYFVREVRPPYYLEQVFLVPLADLATLPPSQLLSARNRAVPFAHRETELQELTDWRDSNHSASVLLIHGPGGQGKTRLADKFFSDSQDAGWHTRIAHHVAESIYRSDAGNEVLEAGVRAPALVIVDYAERWPLEDLLRLASELRDEQSQPIRFLFLARSADWWPPLRHRFSQHGWHVQQYRLDPLVQPAHDRIQMFELACNQFGHILGIEHVGQKVQPPRLLAEQFELVLSIHMAALATVLAHVEAETAPSDPTLISAYLLDRERSYWEGLKATGRTGCQPRTISRAVFSAVLAGPMSHAEGVRLLDMTDTSSALEPSSAILDDHRTCYPAFDPSHVLQPLYPDRLAEDFLALQIPGSANSAHESDAWTESALRALLGPEADLPQEVIQKVLVTLVETSYRWRHVTDRHLFPTLLSKPALGATLGGAGLLRLATMQEVSLDVLSAVDDSLPQQRHLEFDVARSVIGRKLLPRRLAEAEHPIQQARIIANLGSRLEDAGDREGALYYARKTLDLLASLDPEGTGKYDPIVAPQLLNLSGRLAQLGRFREAADAAARSAEIYRRLVDFRADLFEAGLSAALNNLGMALSKNGELAGAAVAVSEAIEIRQRLASQDSEEYEPELAASLDNLGIIYSELSRKEDALEVTAQAVEIFRRLWFSNPARLERELAAALDNLGGCLWSTGSRERAIEVISESVEHFRRLAEANRDAFGEDLAKALANLARKLWEVGRRDEAIGHMEAAVEVKGVLAKRYPAIHSRTLPDDLLELSEWLADVDEHTSCVEHLRDALKLYANPEVFSAEEVEPRIAHAIDMLGVSLAGLGDDEAALVQSLEAVGRFRRQVEMSEEHIPSLAVALKNLGLRHSALGEHTEAASATAEAVSLMRSASSDVAGRYYDLGVALGAFAYVREQGGLETEGAVEAADESMAIFYGLREEYPEDAAGFCLAALHTKVRLLEAQGLHAEADEIRRLFGQADGGA